MKASDRDLWRRVRRKDKKAFETLYKCYYPALCLYAHGIIRHEEYVKEIVNDVFLNLWDKSDTIEIKIGIRPYLYRCVHNGAMDHLSSKKMNRQMSMTTISEKTRELSNQDDEHIFQMLSFQEVERDVMKSIDQLPPHCREIFLLSRFELLTYNEISEKLNISVNTVKTQISRALDSLRVSLKKYL